MSTAATPAIVTESDKEAKKASKVVFIESEVQLRLEKRRREKIGPYAVINLAELYQKKLICGGVIPTEIRRSSELSAGVKVLVSALVEMQATLPDVRPSMRRLAFEIGLGEDQTRRLVKEAVSQKILRVEHRKSESTPSLNAPNRYAFVYNPAIFDADEEQERKCPKRQKGRTTTCKNASTREDAGTGESAGRGTRKDAGRVLADSQGGYLQECKAISNTSEEHQNRDTSLGTPPPPAASISSQQNNDKNLGGGGDKAFNNSSSKEQIQEEEEDLEYWEDTTTLHEEDDEAILRIERKSEFVGLKIDGLAALRLKKIAAEKGYTLRQLACLVDRTTLRGADNPVALLISKAKQMDFWVENTTMPGCDLCENTTGYQNPYNQDWYYCLECPAGRAAWNKEKARLAAAGASA